MISIDDLVPGRTYVGTGVNFNVGVWNSQYFVGVAVSNDDFVVTTERHTDSEEGYGSFVPKKELGELLEFTEDLDDADHFGPWGTKCENEGDLDAGECWICQIIRLEQVNDELEDRNSDLWQGLDSANDAFKRIFSECEDAMTEAEELL